MVNLFVAQGVNRDVLVLGKRGIKKVRGQISFCPRAEGPCFVAWEVNATVLVLLVARQANSRRPSLPTKPIAAQVTGRVKANGATGLSLPPSRSEDNHSRIIPFCTNFTPNTRRERNTFTRRRAIKSCGPLVCTSGSVGNEQCLFVAGHYTPA